MSDKKDITEEVKNCGVNENSSWNKFIDATKKYIVDMTEIEVEYQGSRIWQRFEEFINKINQLKKENDEIRQEIFNMKYPNGKIIIECKSTNTEILATSVSFQQVYNGDYILLFNTKELYNDMTEFKSLKLDNHQYLVYSVDYKYNFIVNTLNKSAVQVDKDMKVVL
jgi:hypothetical protein